MKYYCHNYLPRMSSSVVQYYTEGIGNSISFSFLVLVVWILCLYLFVLCTCFDLTDFLVHFRMSDDDELRMGILCVVGRIFTHISCGDTVVFLD